MTRKKKFALPMEDGAEVRNIDDLRAHFDISSVVRDFCNGKLLTWLEDRYYDEEAAAIKALSPDDYGFQKKLCEIFGVETPEEIERRIERLNRLKTFINDEKILSNVDKVAFDQEELADLLDEGADEIYLCANRFVIPLRMKNKVYIGVKDAVAILGNKNPSNFAKLGIKFKNVAFNDDSSKIPIETEVKPPANIIRATTAIIKDVGCDEAATFVLKSGEFQSKIWLNRAKKRNGGGNDVISILRMNLIEGDRVTITAEGSDAKKAVDELKNLIDSGLQGASIKDVYNNLSVAVTTTQCYICSHPASVFVQTSSRFKSKIRLLAKGKTVDAKSILMIISLCLAEGTRIIITAEGSDADEAVNVLKGLIDNKCTWYWLKEQGL